MKKISVLILMTLIFWSNDMFAFKPDSKQLDLEAIFYKYELFPASVRGINMMDDGEHYTAMANANGNTCIVKYKLSDASAVDTLFSSKSLLDNKLEPNINGYKIVEALNVIVLTKDTESIYRHSTRANHYIYDIKEKSIKAVSNNGKQRYPSISPDGKKVAFVRANNLFYNDLITGKETKITTDGKANEIINGASDWVYEEEFVLTRAFEWSPNSDKIAFYRFDESHVNQFTMMMYNNGAYPGAETFKYPKAGEQNAYINLNIYHLNGAKKDEIFNGDQKDLYIPRIYWTNSNDELVYFEMNRHQNHLQLQKFNTATKSLSLLMEEKNEYYIDIHDHLQFFKDNSGFIWTSEKSGFNHVYKYDMNGKEVAQLTKGKFDVTRFYGVDEKNGWIYYQSAETSPLRRQLYRTSLDGKKKEKLTEGAGTHSGTFNNAFTYFIHRFSNVNTPPIMAVRKSDGSEVRILEDNAEYKKRIAAYDLPEKEFFTIKTKDKVTLNAWKILPKDFDENKKYPVFMYCYSGPGSQTVKDSWGGMRDAWFLYLAQEGYIVVSVDNRGTGARGEEFKKMTYLQLGKYEVEDQIQAAEYLAKQSYVDDKRIGMFGWSYGGYMSSLCLLKGSHVFSTAIAVAPVTNWKWYDSIYTERYMRTPQENESGYEDNSPVNFTDELKGKYLLIHGTADDNVHFQNAVEMTSALVKSNKQFDNMYYPNKNHGIYGGVTTLNLYTRMTNFVKANL